MFALMRKVVAVVGFLFAAAIVGCGPTVNLTKTTARALPPSDATKVAILQTRPTQPYEELGLLATRNAPDFDVEKVYAEFRKSAATLGADAVVITNRRDFRIGFQSGFDLDGLAIKYK